MTVAKTNGATTMGATTNVFTENEKLQNNVSLPQKNEGNDDEEDEITLEDLAPDGGWGWIVAIAMTVVFLTIFGPTTSFAIVFGEFLESTGNAGTVMTLCNSVFMITYSIAGLMTNTLLRKFSMRPVGLFGAVIFSVPNVCLAFVTSVFEMAFLSFLQGMGLGLLLTICNTNFNAYFVKKRAPVMSASQVIIGMGGIAYPIWIEKMMKMYGFRGTALVVGAMSLNCIAGMMMMHPVEWHARKPEEVRAERARAREERRLRDMVLSDRRYSDMVRTPTKTRWSSLTSLKGDSGKQVPLLIETLKPPAKRVASISEIEGRISNRIKSGSMRELLTRRLSAFSSTSMANLVSGIGSLGEVSQLRVSDKAKEKRNEKGVQVSMTDDDKDNGKGALDEVVNDFLEMSLLKNIGFLNICFGISFVLSSDYTFSSLLPMMMTKNGYTQSHAATALTIGAAAELVSKILLAIFTLLVKVKSKHIFFVAMICMAFAKAGYLCYNHTLTGTFAMVAVMGMVRSWLLVPQPLAIIEDISVDKFASAYGISGAINGIISILFGPIVGFLKDWTNSFVVCQLALLLMNVLFVIPWAIQFLSDLLKRRKERADKIAARTSGSLSAD